MSNKDITYRISKVDIISSYLHPLKKIGLKSVEPIENIQFSTEITTNFINEEGKLTIKLFIEYFYEEASKLNPLFGADVLFTYELQDYETAIKVEENRIAVPDGLLSILLAVSIGAMRGILISLTIKTDYEDLYYPIVSQEQLKSLISDLKQLKPENTNPLSDS